MPLIFGDHYNGSVTTKSYGQVHGIITGLALPLNEAVVHVLPPIVYIATYL
jgi:hypothetical protein